MSAAGPAISWRSLAGWCRSHVAERELIAAYVCGLNACRYCHGVHTATAQAFGISEGTLGALLDDLGTAPVAERIKPLLRYVGKLTLTPAKIIPG
jgi:AhpD family alkylhydroperoxidase